MLENNADWLQRSRILLGDTAIERLQQTHVLLAGFGGVGAYAAEALVRAGIGKLTIYDPDKVHLTNLNRQLPALHSTLDEYKVKVAAGRLPDINPGLELHGRRGCADIWRRCFLISSALIRGWSRRRWESRRPGSWFQPVWGSVWW